MPRLAELLAAPVRNTVSRVSYEDVSVAAYWAQHAKSKQTWQRLLVLKHALRRYEQLPALFRQFKGEGYTPAIVHYNLLMSGAGHRGELAQVYRWLDEALAARLVPNAYTYTILLEANVRANEMSNAVRIFEQAQTVLPALKVEMYTMLIKGYAATHAWPQAWHTWNLLRSSSVKPDGVAYAQMFHVCTKSNELPRAIALYDEMMQTATQATEVTYAQAIACLARGCKHEARYYDYCLAIMRDMQGAGFVPGPDVARSLLRAASYRCDWSNMLGMRGFLQSHGALQLGDECLMLHGIATALTRYRAARDATNALHAKANEIVELALDAFEPTASLLEAALETMRRTSMLDRANALVARFAQLGVAPTDRVYLILHEIAARRGERVSVEMHWSALSVDARTAAALQRLHAFCKLHDTERALRLFYELHESGIRLRPVHVAPLIGLLTRARMQIARAAVRKIVYSYSNRHPPPPPLKHNGDNAKSKKRERSYAIKKFLADVNTNPIA